MTRAARGTRMVDASVWNRRQRHSASGAVGCAPAPRRHAAPLVALALASASCTPLLAQSEQPATPAPGSLETGAGWNLAFTPYVWLTGFSGNATVRGIDLNVDATFTDILEESDRVFGLMGALDLEHDRWVFQLNGAWTTAEASKSQAVLRDGTLDADVKVDSLWGEFFAGYRLVKERIGDSSPARNFTLDAFVGGRVTDIAVDTTLTASAAITLPGGEVLSPGRTAERDQSQTWFEPFVGARARVDITEHLVAELRADVGGFGLDGAHFSWQTVAAISYQWRLSGWNLALFAGYRALGQDYSSGEFAWDAVTHGPLMGASCSWAF